MMRLILILLMVSSCGAWKKKNQPQENITVVDKLNAVNDGLKFYCSKIRKNYVDVNGRVAACDSALMGGLAGVACDGVDITPFENESIPGQMCRSWECNCFVAASDGQPKFNNGSNSRYSKDMNAGIMLNQTVRPIPGLIDRIVKFLVGNKSQICSQDEAIDFETYLSKCVLPPNTMARWFDLQKKFGLNLDQFAFSEKQPEQQLTGRTGFEAHLAVIGIHTEAKIYGAISDISLSELKEHAERQPNNVLYVASYEQFNHGNMEHAADLWLEQCPQTRMPNNRDDYCTDYRYSRDEEETMKDGQLNWKPCPNRTFEEHPGIDCAIAAWAIIQGT